MAKRPLYGTSQGNRYQRSVKRYRDRYREGVTASGITTFPSIPQNLRGLGALCG